MASVQTPDLRIQIPVRRFPSINKSELYNSLRYCIDAVNKIEKDPVECVDAMIAFFKEMNNQPAVVAAFPSIRRTTIKQVASFSQTSFLRKIDCEDLRGDLYEVLMDFLILVDEIHLHPHYLPDKN